MVEKEAIEIAIHCLGVQAEQEVCEECPAYNKGGIFCREAVRTAISALKEIQQYREIGTVEEIKDLLAMVSEAAEDVDESGISVGFIKDLIQLGEYRKIGTVEECREAREKQTPNKPPERSRRQISQKTGYMVMDILHVDRVKIRWTEMKTTVRSADRLSGGKIKILKVK